MQRHNWNTLGLFVGALAIQVAALHSWTEMASTTFVAGCLAQLAVVLKAMIQDSPTTKQDTPPTLLDKKGLDG